MEEYINVFLDEAQEHLQSLNENVLKMEKNPEDLNVVGEIFRSAHTFKGMSATMGFKSIADLTHEMENVLDLIRNEKMTTTGEVVDVIFDCIDNLEQMVADIQGGGQGALDVTDVVNRLKELQGKEKEASSNNQKDVNDATEMDTSFLEGLEKPSHIIKVKIDEGAFLKAPRAFMVVNGLEELSEVIATNPTMEKIEQDEFDFEFLVAVLTTKDEEELRQVALNVTDVEDVIISPYSEEKKEEKAPAKKSNKPSQATPKKQFESRSIRVNLDKIEHLMNMFEETVIERGRIEELIQVIENPELHEHVQRLATVSKELQNLVLNMRMVPIETIFNRFPRMVRSLSKDLGKEIDLIIEGEDTEIDRIVSDEVGDPLVHLIRNAVDHGVETPEKRVAVGKPSHGTVRLEAFHSGNNVVIQITDDGAGIDRNVILKKAVSKGVVTESEGSRMSNSEVYDLMFASGFSTAEVVSDVSGRGVGLDVVKNTIQNLGGSIQIDSELGKGSVFRVELPLTLSIIQSMLIGSKGHRYALPLENIVETMRLPKTEVHDLQGKDVINYREKTIPLLHLSKLFGYTATKEERDRYQLVVLKTNDNAMYAMVVDEIFGQREIVLKSLGDFFRDKAPYFSGATILGDGRVVLIIDCDSVRKF